MSYAGTLHTYYFDYNSLRVLDGREVVGCLISHSDSPVQTQLFPPQVGDVVIGDDSDPTAPPARWARVIRRESGWMELELMEALPRVVV